MREVNERVIGLVTAPAADRDTMCDLICECYDTQCIETLTMTVAEYEAVRNNPRRFPVKRGHVLPDVEKIVETHDRYMVVEKTGEAGEIAEATVERERYGE
jgi:hypothetical protein